MQDDIALRCAHLIASDGVPLTHYRLAPRGRRRGVAYVAHGQAHYTMSMRDTLEGLAGRGWEVHGVDMRGHGRSASSRAPRAHMEIGATPCPLQRAERRSC